MHYPLSDTTARDDLLSSMKASIDLPNIVETLEASEVWPLAKGSVSSCIADAPLLEKVPKQPFGPCNCDAEIKNTVDALVSQHNLILEGVAGIGKTHLIEAISKHLAHVFFGPFIVRNVSAVGVLGAAHPDYVAKVQAAFRGLLVDIQIVVLHPSSSYEELVCGLRPEWNGTEKVTQFNWVAGPLITQFGTAADEFQSNAGATHLHLIVLDEINRCNLPSVLGELMHLIDPSRRMTCKKWTAYNGLTDKTDIDAAVRDGLAVRIPNLSKTNPPVFGEHGAAYVTDSVFVLGTMNSSDRSILGLDQALRRRFPPMRMEPHTADQWIISLKSLEVPNALLESVGLTVVRELLDWLALNAVLRARLGPDGMIGHSYFYGALTEAQNGLPALRNAFTHAWRFGVLPQVIHAAEAAREEVFAKKIFVEDRTGIDLDVADSELQLSAEQVGFPNAKRFAQQWREGTVGAYSICRKDTLDHVGRGHGKRLLIVPRPSKKARRSKTAKWRPRVDDAVLEILKEARAALIRRRTWADACDAALEVIRRVRDKTP